MDRPTATTVSAEATERLRALGYVSGSPASRSDDARAPNPARTIGAWTRFERALSQLQAGEASAAVPVLKALVAEHPGAPVFHSTYARALKDAGDVRAAVKVYKAAVARWPEDPALFHDLAELAAVGEVGGEEFLRTPTRPPRLSEAWFC